MYLWRKRAELHWVEAHESLLQARDCGQLVIVSRPAHKRLELEIVCRSRSDSSALLKEFGAVSFLDESQSRKLWRSIRYVMPFATETARTRPLWRISVPPRRGHEIARAITPAAQMFYDWAGGLVWVAMPFAGEPDAAAIRGAVAAVDVFAPEEPAVRALGKRVKESFDPKGLLNPGRMWAGA